MSSRTTAIITITITSTIRSIIALATAVSVADNINEDQTQTNHVVNKCDGPERDVFHMVYGSFLVAVKS